MDWKEYEKVTRDIYEALGQKVGVKIIGYGNSCKVKGKSGIDHQIDVLTEHSDGIHYYKTAIECKHWNVTVNKDIVMKVESIVEDALINKGVIVSKLGFTSDAIEYARFKNIGLIELRELNDSDWEGRIENICVKMHIVSAEILGLEILIDQSTQPNIKPGEILIEGYYINEPSGKKIEMKEYVKLFQDEIYARNQEKIEIEKIYEFPEGSVLVNSLTNTETQIKGLKFKGFLRIGTQEIKIKGRDHIWLIMKSIFEGNSYTITKTGIINERK